MRMLLVPVPGRTDDRLNIVVLRLPAKHGLCLFRGRDELRWVSRAALRHFALNWLADDLLRGVDDLLNREADAVAEVEHVVLAAVHQIFRGENVRRSKVGNVDVTIIAQAPKMRPHIDAMRAKIAEDLHCDIEQVNVKATTTEKLGFTGRSEGIACEAVALLLKA